jgi:hypothetical protein
MMRALAAGAGTRKQSKAVRLMRRQCFFIFIGEALFLIIYSFARCLPVLVELFKASDLFLGTQLGFRLLPPACNAANLRAELAEIAVRAGVFFIAAFFHR